MEHLTASHSVEVSWFVWILVIDSDNEDFIRSLIYSWKYTFVWYCCGSGLWLMPSVSGCRMCTSGGIWAGADEMMMPPSCLWLSAAFLCSPITFSVLQRAWYNEEEEGSSSKSRLGRVAVMVIMRRKRKRMTTICVWVTCSEKDEQSYTTTAGWNKGQCWQELVVSLWVVLMMMMMMMMTLAHLQHRVESSYMNDELWAFHWHLNVIRWLCGHVVVVGDILEISGCDAWFSGGTLCSVWVVTDSDRLTPPIR